MYFERRLPHAAALVRAVQFTILLFGSAYGAGAVEKACPEGYLFVEDDCRAKSRYTNLPVNDSQPMKFDAVQRSMATIYFQGIGTITKDIPQELQTFLNSYDGRMSKNLFLHSPGGHLIAGLELGEIIRENQLNTFIGRSIPLEGAMNTYDYHSAYCLSSCAYAFLGGVTRSYDESAVYGVHRFGRRQGSTSGDDAQVISSLIARYIQAMGVDLSVFILASSASFEDDIFVIPVDAARRMRIIFDDSGLTSFQIEFRDGTIVAAFQLGIRERSFGGLVLCIAGRPALVLFDEANSIPPILRTMNRYPAEFTANRGRELAATATYVARDFSVPYVLFEIAGLDEEAFSGEGLSLNHLWNPSLERAPLVDNLLWADAVTAFTFRIQADNSMKTLPIIFRSCSG